MNPLIDAQKRSIELPFGCKDLVDVLASANREPNSKAGWKLLNGLQETERYLAGLLLTPTALLYLEISITHTQHRLQLAPIRDQLCILLSIDGSDKGRLSRIRNFFSDAQIPAIVDVMGSISVIDANSRRILILPLPVVAVDAAELIARVLREGFAVSEEAQIYIASNEMTIA